MRRALLAVAVLLGALVGAGAPGAPGFPGTNAPTAEAAPSDIVAVVVEGTGFGHGRGMSQWGAYGWAVDQGRTWQQILDHYYGGTTLGDVNTAQTRIRVRLLGFDGASIVGVTSGTGNVTAGAVTARSLYAKEIANNQFEIWGTASVACPGASGLQVPNGPLQRGATGDPVRQIQTFLNAFRAGTDPVLAVDGQFGPATESRLKGWQTSQSLPANGIWDGDDAARARQLIGGGTATWTKQATVAGPVTFTAANGETSSAAASAVLGACDASGRVTHYRGKLVFHNATSNANWLVNDVKTEDYLRGVVPKEVSANWANAGGGKGANAVRAQAVAARSYGLAQNRYAPYASTCDSMSCQVYGGSATRPTANGAVTNVEHALSDAAIAATANKVRLRNGAVVSTEFSASNGPRTAGNTFPVVDDTLGDRTANNPNHRWTRVIDADAIRAKYGLSAITSVAMVEAASAENKKYDGIWFNDVLLNGSRRIEAWTFRGDFGLPSPGFTIRVVTRDTTTTTFGMIGDSVGNSIAGSPTAEFSTLIDGTFASARLDMKDSRCTVNTACPRPSGVEAVASLPANLDLVVVQLGYNDWSPDMATAIDAMMRALNARGVRQVAWVNLASATKLSSNADAYASRNAALQAATQRWSNLSVLDWNTFSNTAEKTRWFSTDGVHLTATGQAKFAVWLREQVIAVAPSSRLGPPRRIEVPIAGETLTAPTGQPLVVPQNVAAAALNVTVVGPSGAGFVTSWPCGGARPNTSSLNYPAGAIVGNGVFAPVGANGKTCLYSHQSTDVVVDITGWFAAGSSTTPGFVAATPGRLADTRDGTGVPKRPVQPASPVAISVHGRRVTFPDGTVGNVPANATAAAVNVTTVGPRAGGFVTVWPCGTTRPTTSSLNYAAGAIDGNGVLAPIGADGSICLYAHTPTEVVVDLMGWFTAGPGAPTTAPFVAAVPDRFVDTRDGTGAPQGVVRPASPLAVQVTGRQMTVGGTRTAIPAGASAVALNITAVSPRGGGFATVWPCGATRPETSSLNFAAGAIKGNNVVAPIGKDGKICIYTHVDSHVVVDVTGWFAGGAQPGFVGSTPDRLVDTRYRIGPLPI